MTVVYRLVKKKYQGSPLDGEGASRFGGRWNSVGRRVVYASDSRALCLLENLVHLEDGAVLLAGFVLFELTLSDDRILDLRGDLPAGWNSYPANSVSRAIGDQWIDSGSSLALAVPSVVVPREQNILINPAHPDLDKIQVEGPIPLEIDPRLV